MNRSLVWAGAIVWTLWLGCRDMLRRVDDNLADLED